MKLKDKREIVRRFWAGESVLQIAPTIHRREHYPGTDPVEQVIRDYMNGKFELKPKPARLRRSE